MMRPVSPDPPTVLLLAAVLTLGCTRAESEPEPPTMPTGPHTLLPVPALATLSPTGLRLDPAFSPSLTGHTEPRLERAVARFMERLARETGLAFQAGVGGTISEPHLDIRVGKGADSVPGVREDESYRLTVEPGGAVLESANPYGALRGLETFLQLIETDSAGPFVRAAVIRDAPRFPWRGLLLDVSRHFMPLEVVKRTLDGMAAVKLNVLHWHLSEDQGFRAESRRFPRLHQLGSDGDYYTQDQLREIIAYAADRGIRVVPEFDMPAHTTSWFVGHPELASAPGPYQIERRFGVFDPTMDPTREEVYEFLDAFIGEMAAVFADPYFHIGGDEVTGRHWNRNPRIQAFMRRENIGDNHELQAHFNRRLHRILTGHGKRMVGWGEIFAAGIPNDIVVQSWRGQETLAEAARQGYEAILSHGYYLDLIQPAWYHYSVDPLAGEAASLTPDERARVLGGEACMWAEFVTPENVDSRIWPRAAAVAERLWSPAEVNDVEDMYRRLDAVSDRLTRMGLTHQTSYPAMLERLAGGADIGPLRVLADVVEPVKLYVRHQIKSYRTHMPLVRLVDAARPESRTARRFNGWVDAFLADSTRAVHRDAIREQLVRWRDHQSDLEPIIQRSQALREVQPLSQSLARLGDLGLVALQVQDGTTALTPAVQAQQLTVLDRAARPVAEVEIMVVEGVRKLVEAAHGTP